MEAPADLSELEMLCEAFYGGVAEKQGRAHEVLLPLVENPSNISQLQTILANTNHLQSLLFATSGLNKLFTLSWNQISEKQKSETRQFLLNYLYNRGPGMLVKAPVILGHFVRLLCRIVKLSWLENVANQNIVEQVSQFLQASTGHWIVGLYIYTELTQDMQPQLGPKMARHRRIALSFKDNALPEIFQVAIQTLQQFHGGAILVNNSTEEEKLLKQVLQLSLNSLSYDFLGTVPDESDEQASVMIPHTWNILREENIPKMFFDMYYLCWCYKDNNTSSIISAQTKNVCTLRIECATLCISCLVLISALRRSFFQSEEERRKHLSELIVGTSKIIKNEIGLHNDACFHEFCRLIGKINASNQLSELCISEEFNEWSNQLFRFTLDSLCDWKRLPNSKHYLLGVWGDMVTSMIYLKDKIPKGLDEYVQQITIAYIESRMHIAECFGSSGENNEDIDFENPLTNEVLRNEQLDALAILGRCRFNEIFKKVIELFHKNKEAMQKNTISQKLFLEKMTWLVYMTGALLGGNSLGRLLIPRSPIDGDMTQFNVVKGELSSLVFQLIEESNKWDTVPESLEMAYLYFMEQFRKIYLGETSRRSLQVSSGERLAKVLGFDDDDSILDLIVQKIGYNLQHRYNMENVIKSTLQIFHELSSGINVVHTVDRSPHLIVSGRLMLKNNTVQHILNNHSHESFKFLFIEGYGKYRTSYYYSLGKLLFMEIRNDKEKFERFMNSMGEAFEKLLTAMHNESNGSATGAVSQTGVGASRDNLLQNNNDVFNNTNNETVNNNIFSHHATIVVGLCRDLRGICMACASAESYNLLFSWLINKPKQSGLSRVHVFTWAADKWWHNSSVIIPVLKFMAEFVYNKSQRITFDQSSANGILLFKEVSSIILSYGNRILKEDSFVDMYREKYKGMAIALEMLSHALAGNYVNFGIFEVYRDLSLVNSLNLALRMCLAIPDRDLQAYIKALKPYYLFLDLVARNFMPQLLELSPELLRRLLGCVEDGLCSFENVVPMECCSILDSIITFFYTRKDSNDADAIAVCRFLQEEPEALKRILQLMFQLVITGEYSSTWSMARPLLGLILLHQSEFMLIRKQLEDQHSDEKKTKLQTYFTDLMQGVEANLTSKNKELFTKNLYQFSHLIRTLS